MRHLMAGPAPRLSTSACGSHTGGPGNIESPFGGPIIRHFRIAPTPIYVGEPAK